MRNKDSIILMKMINYCKDVAFLIEGSDYEEFIGNIMRNRACTQTVAQIGELSKSLTESLKEKHSDVPWKGIRNLRNFISHEYEKIERKTIWDVVAESIPQLLEQLEAILKDLDNNINIKGDN